MVAVSLSRIDVPLALLGLGIGLPSVRLEVGGAMVDPGEAAVMVALVAYVARRMLRKEPLVYPQRLHWPVLAVGLVYLVAFLRQPDWVLTSYEFSAIKVFYRLALGIVVYFVVAGAVGKRDVPVMVGGLLVGVAINVAYGFQQWLTGDTAVEGGLREGVGALMDVHYGPYLGFGLVTCGAALLAVRRQPLRLALAALLVAVGVQMIMANSLTAVLSLVLLGSALLAAFVSAARGRGVPLLALGVLGLGLGVLWFAAYGGPVRDALAGSPVLGRATNAFSGDDISVRSRAFHWELARGLIAKHPLGMGLDGYRRYYLENFSYDVPTSDAVLIQGERGVSAHNMFLDVGLATGWLGDRRPGVAPVRCLEDELEAAKKSMVGRGPGAGVGPVSRAGPVHASGADLRQQPSAGVFQLHILCGSGPPGCGREGSPPRGRWRRGRLKGRMASTHLQMRVESRLDGETPLRTRAEIGEGIDLRQVVEAVGSLVTEEERAYYFRYHYYRFLETLKLGPPRPGTRLLDVGVVPGHLALCYQELGAEVVGLNITLNPDWPPGVMDCLRRAGMTVVAADVTRDPLPFPNSSFDLVLFTEVLEHFEQHPEPALRECSAGAAAGRMPGLDDSE